MSDPEKKLAQFIEVALKNNGTSPGLIEDLAKEFAKGFFAAGFTTPEDLLSLNESHLVELHKEKKMKITDSTFVYNAVHLAEVANDTNERWRKKEDAEKAKEKIDKKLGTFVYSKF